VDETDGMTGEQPAQISFAVLGPLEVRLSGTVVPLPAGTRRSLLATLLLTPGRVLPVERLVDAVWREDPPADARGSVQTNVARLRRSLGVAGRLLRTQDPGYVLDAPKGSRDVDLFVDLTAAARSALAAGDHSRSVEAVDRALALWRGPAWSDLAGYGPAHGETLALEELRTGAEEDRARALLGLGRASEAVAALEDLAARHPLRDGSVGLLADALHATGRTADALAVLARHREHLAEELGLDPSPAMADRQARLLRGEPATVMVARPGPPEDTGQPAGGPTTTGAFGALPVGPPGPLLGRDGDLADLAELLGGSGPVTLVGPGGVGKTRLALAAAAASGRPAGWVDLAALRDPAAVAEVVADVLGVEATIGIPVTQAMLRRAAGVDGLLVLDNCEHLLDATASLVAELTAHAPDVQVLATSRERLGVPGERVVPVRPLAVEESDPSRAPAVELFVERARSVDPDVDVTGQDLDLVVEICRALDGLPLAIELAAARVGTLTVADLAERLDTRFEILRHGPRSASPRHRTLRSVVDWSYDLLDEEEAAVFTRLSVFAARFDLAAAEHVVSGEGVAAERVADVVARLVDRSMLTRPRGRGAGRYRMLDTLRRYALSRLPADELARLQRRHATWVLDLLEQAEVGLSGPDEVRWHALLEEAMPDVRLAWRLAGTVDDAELAVRIVAALWRWAYWRVRVEVLGWGEQAAEVAPEGHPLLPQTLMAAAASAWFSGDQDRAYRLGERSLEAAGGVTHPAAADALDLLGDISVVGGEPLRAARHCLAAATGHRAHGRAASAAVSAANAALALSYAGRPDPDLLDACVREAAATGNPTARAFICYTVAENLADVDPERAVAAYDEALALAHEVGNTLVTGVARTGRVALLARHGPADEAAQGFGEVLARWQESGARSMVVTTLRNLVLLLVRTQHDRAALELAATVQAAGETYPSYGLEAERLAAAVDDATARLGTAAAAAAREAGEVRTLAEAAERALVAARS
jgi:predicted ATPase/DNA-binding SARP family transcriptional activator